MHPEKVKLMVETIGSDIYIGDIMKLSLNQTVPCDLLVLASSEVLNGNQVCKVDSWFDDGKSLRHVKEAVSLTKSFNHLSIEDKNATRFLARLNAKIDYWIDIEQNIIQGTFKLRSDPRIETFGESMVIRKGSVLKSNYIWGLVLYNGNRCLDKKTRSSVISLKTNSIQAKVRTFCIFLLILNLILCSFSYLFSLKSRESSSDKVSLLESKTTFFTFVSLYFSAVPLALNISINLVTGIAAIILQRKYTFFKNTEQYNQINKKTTIFQTNPKDLSNLSSLSDPRSRPISFSIIDPEVVLNLGDIDDVFFDKTDTLTTTEYDVKTIGSKSSLYLSEKGTFYPDQKHEDLDLSDSEESEEKVATVDDLRLKLDYSDYSVIKNKFLNKGAEFDIKTPRMPMTPFEQVDDRLDTEEPLLTSAKETPGRPGSTRNPSDVKSAPVIYPIKAEVHLGSALLKPSISPTAKYTREVLDKADLWKDRKSSMEVKKMLLMFAVCHKSKPINNR